MSDTVSRQALNDLIKNRLSKVLVYASDAEEIKDPFDRGKATAYQNILYDISTKLSPIELEKEIESLKAITELKNIEIERLLRIVEQFRPMCCEYETIVGNRCMSCGKVQEGVPNEASND